MFGSFGRWARSAALLAVAAALTVGGVALAQGGSGGGSEGGPSGRAGKRMPPPSMLPGGKDLTYAQIHVQHEGEAQVIRLDSGKITAVSDSSITLEENDGNEVTVSVDESTKVLAGPGKSTAVTDLEDGQQVVVCGPEGGTAKTIMLPPKGGHGPHGGPPQMQG